MANPEHLAILNAGPEALKSWRTNNRFTTLNLQDAALANRVFEGYSLYDVDFTGADLEGASFKNARMGDVLFDSCNLKSVNFEKASFDFADFTGADIEGIILKNCKFERGAIFTDVQGRPAVATKAQRKRILEDNSTYQAMYPEQKR